METKQVKFKDEENTFHYGILITNGYESYVICGCCGGILTVGEDCEIIQEMEWIDIEYAICGEQPKGRYFLLARVVLVYNILKKKC